MKKCSEAEFGVQIVKILHALGFETWQEVYLGTGQGNPCIDIVARLGKIYFAFELKRYLNDEVLVQAARNRKYVDYTIALAPDFSGKVHSFSSVKLYYAKDFGIGVYTVNPEIFNARIERILKKDSSIDVLKELYRMRYRKHFWLQGCVCYSVAKRITRKRKRRKKGKLLIETYLFEEQKKSIAGSRGGERSTPFKRSCAKIREYLEEHPGTTRKEVWGTLGKELHWRSYNSMCSSFRAWHDKLDCMKNIVFGKG